MDIYVEHSLYTWLIIIGIVCVAVIVGVLVDRFRMIRATRLPLELRRRRDSLKQ